MTIGTKLLHEAKEKLEAALAAIKEELKNPDLAGEVKSSAFDLGTEIDKHLNDLGESLGNFGDETQEQPQAAGIVADDPTEDYAGDPIPDATGHSIEAERELETIQDALNDHPGKVAE